jgi:HEAT repeat protein
LEKFGGIMDLSMEQPAGEWYSSLPRAGDIYRLIDSASADRDRDRRIRAVIALGATDDPRAVRPLMACCSDPDPAIRGCAIAALGKLRSGRAVPVLIERMRDKNEERQIREHAALALAGIRSAGALRSLREFAENPEEDGGLRSRIREMLDRAQNE